MGAAGQRAGGSETCTTVSPTLRMDAARAAHRTAFGPDGELPVADRDIDVFGRIDAGNLGAHFVPTVSHLVFQSHQPGVDRSPYQAVDFRSMTGILK